MPNRILLARLLLFSDQLEEDLFGIGALVSASLEWTKQSSTKAKSK